MVNAQDLWCPYYICEYSLPSKVVDGTDEVVLGIHSCIVVVMYTGPSPEKPHDDASIHFGEVSWSRWTTRWTWWLPWYQEWFLSRVDDSRVMLN